MYFQCFWTFAFVKLAADMGTRGRFVAETHYFECVSFVSELLFLSDLSFQHLKVHLKAFSKRILVCVPLKGQLTMCQWMQFPPFRLQLTVIIRWKSYWRFLLGTNRLCTHLIGLGFLSLSFWFIKYVFQLSAGLFIGLSLECFAVVLFLPRSVSALCSPVATPWDVDGPSRFRPSVHLAAINWPLQLLISSRCSAAAAVMHTLTAEVNECSFVVGTLVCRRCGAREARKVESAQLSSSAWSLSEWKIRYL